MKKLSTLFVGFLALTTLAGCNKEEEHSHDFSNPTFDWSHFDLDKNSGEVYVNFKCSCGLESTKLAAVSSDIHVSCTEPGYKRYVASYESSNFGGRYQDSKEMTYSSVTGHDLVKTDRVESTCLKTGNIEFYFCNNCEKTFSDAAGTIEVSDVTIPRKEHTMEQFGEKQKTCTEDGYVAHYHCTTCNYDFLDENGNEPLDNVVIKGGHVLEEHRARESTCCAEGCVHYFGCKVCGKAFDDANATNEIKTKVTIDKLDHQMTHYDSTQVSCTIPYEVEHYHCSLCNFNYEDEQGTKRLDTISFDSHEHTINQNHVCTDCGLEIGEINYQNVLRDPTKLVENTAMSAPTGFSKLYTYDYECGGDNDHLFFKRVLENQPLENVIKFTFGFETDRNYIYYMKSRLNSGSTASTRIPYQDYAGNSDPTGFVIVTFVRESVTSHTWKITSTKPVGVNAGSALNTSVTISEDEFYNDLYGVCNITNQNPSQNPIWRLFNITEIITEKVVA